MTRTQPQPLASPSAAVFSSQSGRPESVYLSHVRSRLVQEPLLKPLADAVCSLPATWRSLTSSRRGIVGFTEASRLVEGFRTWIETGDSDILESDVSELVDLPLLTTIHIVQYLEYLQRTGLRHPDFLKGVRPGGIQGCGVGLLSATIVAFSTDEQDVVRSAAAGVRLSLGLGIVQRFPDANAPVITELLASECSALFSQLHYPTSGLLQFPIRSNLTGEPVATSDGALTEEIISAVLASRCDWPLVMQRLASDLGRTGSRQHSIAVFGFGNPVPMAPFQRSGLDVLTVHADMVGAPHIPRTAHAAASTSTFQSFPSHAIAIVGAACRLPGANSLDDLWKIISQGQTRLEKLRTDRVPLRNSYRAWQDPKWVTEREFYGNFIDDVEAFDHAFFGISPREAKYMDPQQRLLLETAFEAMDSSGYLRYHERERGDPVGCFLGASYTEYLENTSAYSPTAFTATGTIRAFLSGRISYHFGWTGPSEVIDTACSASIVAIHRACQAIIAGECPIALAGGVNIITGVHNYFDLGKATFLSKTGQCKPFDDSGDGYCRADGVGLVVLKPLKQAVLDGDNIMGVIPAVATNQGGIGAPGITVPDGIAQRALYRRLLEKSGLQPDDITYVEAHGTGTQAGDPVEMGSIREVFGGPKRSSTLYIGSLKANIGHCETAAGVASLLKVLTMFRNRGIPPLQGFKRLNHKIPALEPHKIHIPTELLPWDTVSGRRVTCVSSFGASGSNSALLCSEWLEESGAIKPNDSMDQPMQEFPVLLSAASPESLYRYVNGLADYISKHESAGTLTIGNLSFTLSQRRKHHRVRWSTATSRLADLVDKLRSCTPQDFVQAPKAAKKVVLVFSGQSKTTIGLSPSALQENPRFKHHIQTCNDILKRLGCPDIVPALSQVEPIADPAILQCGTVAVQYACAQCFLDAGLNVDAIVGHSLGELAALAVSGALSLADALKVVYARAELIKAKWGSEGGTMMAIHADEETVRSIMEIANSTLDYDHDKLEIACHNSATSHVVVGKQTSIALAENTIQQDARYRGIKYQRLNVSHGFHSRFTEPLLQDLVHVGSTVEWKEPAIALETSTKSPVAFSNKTSTRSYIADHARKPVYFVDAVRRAEQRLGPCIWLEAGWNTPIVAMAKRAVANPAIHAFHPVVSPAAAVAKLWLEDIPVAHWDFFAPQKSGLKHIWLPAYSFDRPKFWLEYVDRAIEEQKAAQSMKQANPVTPNCTTTQPLVSYRGSTGSSHQFCLHTTTERYTRIVQGHAVLQKPLCPASMYMEAAIMAMQQLGASAKGKTITFENVVFTKPLGCDDSIDVQLTLDRASTRTSEDAWHYSVRSSSNPKVAHSEGDFSVNTSDSENTDLQLYEMLVGNQMAALQNDPNAERLKTATAYALFSRVVEYADILRGMSTITLGAKQAVAQVRVPKTSFSASESTVADFYDAITTDCFIQVLGLLINCNSGSSADGEIYVASKIGKMVVSPTEFQTPQTWTVYAMFSPLDAKTSSGAVYVFSGDGKLTSYATNIQFVRIQAARLEHALESANRKVSASTPIRPGLIHNNASPAVSLVKDVARPQHSTPATPIPPPLDNATPLSSASDNGADRPQGNAAADLKALISVYTGVPVEEMEANQNLSSMGLDSLASMELADEIESKLGFKVGTDDILLGSVGSLLKLCSLANAEPVSDTCSESSDSTRDSAGESNTPGTTPGTTPEIETPAEQDLKLNSAHAIDCSVPWLRPNGALSSRYRGIDTVVYKEVNGVEILADLYIPMETPPQPMPVALMIHGGGHLTLSRRAVRPHQTRFLLANGIFPVSVDYRLCPQINVLDGAMTDIRDACAWVQRDLPAITRSKGIEIDPRKYVVIGWSTGGTLAMTTSWTVPQAGLAPPMAILSFYCPVEYNPEKPITMGKNHGYRTMPLGEARKLLPSQPETGHAPNSLDTTKLGWVRAGDPRSELVLALVKEERGMALLFNDNPLDSDELPYPDADRAAAFSPLVQVRKGNYSTPTYLVFGDEDEIAPFSKGVEFSRAMENHGVEGGFLAVKGAKHIYDLDLAPGSEGWKMGVGPGYDFLLNQIEKAHLRRL